MERLARLQRNAARLRRNILLIQFAIVTSQILFCIGILAGGLLIAS